MDVIEHLHEPDALALLADCERIARRRVVVFTPNGFLPQGDFRGNPHQVHVSGWSAERLRGLGFRVVGIHGWKPLRTSHARISWRPDWLWRRVSRLSQPLVAGRPELAFQLLCTKDVSPA